MKTVANYKRGFSKCSYNYIKPYIKLKCLLKQTVKL